MAEFTLSKTSQIDDNTGVLTYDVSSLDNEFSNGFRYKQRIPNNYGLLFNWSGPMVMDRCYAPLSAAFLDDSDTIVDIRHMEPEPHTYVPEVLYKSDKPYTKVLEVSKDWFSNNNWSVGDKLSVDDKYIRKMDDMMADFPIAKSNSIFKLAVSPEVNQVIELINAIRNKDREKLAELLQNPALAQIAKAYMQWSNQNKEDTPKPPPATQQPPPVITPDNAFIHGTEDVVGQPGNYLEEGEGFYNDTEEDDEAEQEGPIDAPITSVKKPATESDSYLDEDEEFYKDTDEDDEAEQEGPIEESPKPSRVVAGGTSSVDLPGVSKIPVNPAEANKVINENSINSTFFVTPQDAPEYVDQDFKGIYDVLHHLYANYAEYNLSEEEKAEVKSNVAYMSVHKLSRIPYYHWTPKHALAAYNFLQQKPIAEAVMRVQRVDVTKLTKPILTQSNYPPRGNFDRTTRKVRKHDDYITFSLANIPSSVYYTLRDELNAIKGLTHEKIPPRFQVLPTEKNLKQIKNFLVNHPEFDIDEAVIEYIDGIERRIADGLPAREVITTDKLDKSADISADMAAGNLVMDFSNRTFRLCIPAAIATNPDDNIRNIWRKLSELLRYPMSKSEAIKDYACYIISSKGIADKAWLAQEILGICNSHGIKITKNLANYVRNLLWRDEEAELNKEMLPFPNLNTPELEASWRMGKSPLFEGDFEKIPYWTDDPKRQLHDYQKTGVAYASDKKRTFIADEPGLGKTATALATICKNKAFPALVLAPRSVVREWKDQIAIFTKGINVLELKQEGPSGNFGEIITRWKPIMNEPCIFLGHYELLYDGDKGKKSKGFDLLFRNVPFKAVICDESQKLKNPDAALYRNARQYFADANRETPVEYKLLLTGTPMPNRPYEFMSQLEFLDQLKNFGGRAGFVSRYCPGSTHKTAINTADLGQRLYSFCMVGRKKTDKGIRRQLPKLLQSVHQIDLANQSDIDIATADMNLYCRLLADREIPNIDELRERAKTDSRAARKVEEYERLTEGKHTSSLEVLQRIKNLTGQGKIPFTIDWVSNFLENSDQSEKIVIMAEQVKRVINPIYEEIVKRFGSASVSRIIGDQDVKTRENIMNRFNHGNDLRVLVVGIDAGGAGLNLQRANSLLLVEFPWSRGEYEQAINRVFRIRDKKQGPVTIHTVQAMLDAQIVRTLWRKDVINEAIRGFKDLTTQQQLSLQRSGRKALMNEMLMNLIERAREGTAFGGALAEGQDQESSSELAAVNAEIFGGVEEDESDDDDEEEFIKTSYIAWPLARSIFKLSCNDFMLAKRFDISKQSQRRLSDAVESAIGSCCTIRGALGGKAWTGSGFAISKDKILTCAHIVNDEGKPPFNQDAVIHVVFNKDRKYRAFPIYINYDRDLAILQIDSSIFDISKPLSLGNSDILTEGQEIFTIGSPEGIDTIVSSGIVSSDYRTVSELDVPVFFIDMQIHHGSSGGPVMDMKGNVIGVARGTLEFSQDDYGQEWDSLNYCIPINVAKKWLVEKHIDFTTQV